VSDSNEWQHELLTIEGLKGWWRVGRSGGAACNLAEDGGGWAEDGANAKLTNHGVGMQAEGEAAVRGRKGWGMRGRTEHHAGGWVGDSGIWTGGNGACGGKERRPIAQTGEKDLRACGRMGEEWMRWSGK